MGRQDLTAKIEELNDISIEGCAKYLVNFMKYAGNIDVIIAALHPGLAKKMNDSMEDGYPLGFQEIGHPSIIFNYFQKKGYEFYFCSAEEFPDLLKEVKSKMQKKGQKDLYQICHENDCQKVKEQLMQEGFNLA
ncbi:hypothetical protein KY330_05135 [Candidatus Woesearchaeota archaeon]|nr:hypothetical protein [Candidatus Woesearchaeota archaeon]